ncbi:hypothetical protein B0H15DRAFT_553660 [Mycena belliarum]|uniref:Uncharacterized protein n=1 Tax=Mycena belliarum TaxID=1033014 RepID=A0AAD6UDQ1_9AGAR|nr:hypothetical protein B0H15DRAFT_553660 [Mycena belliae]
MPSCYCGSLDDTLPFLYQPSPDGAPPILKDHFVIVCGLLGAGASSSPSHAPVAQRGPTSRGHIRGQHPPAARVARLAAYIGFSMGAQQAYHMATLYPAFAERAVVLAGSARTSWHNWSFLEGARRQRRLLRRAVPSPRDARHARSCASTRRGRSRRRGSARAAGRRSGSPRSTRTCARSGPAGRTRTTCCASCGRGRRATSRSLGRRGSAGICRRRCARLRRRCSSCPVGRACIFLPRTARRRSGI